MLKVQNNTRNYQQKMKYFCEDETEFLVGFCHEDEYSVHLNYLRYYRRYFRIFNARDTCHVPRATCHVASSQFSILASYVSVCALKYAE